MTHQTLPQSRATLLGLYLELLNHLEVAAVVRQEREIVAERRRADQEIEIGDECLGCSEARTRARNVPPIIDPPSRRWNSIS